jgi:cell division protein FtsB
VTLFLVVLLVVLLAAVLVATVYVVRAAKAVVESLEQTVALYKQTKQILKQVQRTDAVNQRMTDRVYKYQEKIDILMLDPKVQAALNRHNREVR